MISFFVEFHQVQRFLWDIKIFWFAFYRIYFYVLFSRIFMEIFWIEKKYKSVVIYQIYMNDNHEFSRTVAFYEMTEKSDYDFFAFLKDLLRFTRFSCKFVTFYTLNSWTAQVIWPDFLMWSFSLFHAFYKP